MLYVSPGLTLKAAFCPHGSRYKQGQFPHTTVTNKCTLITPCYVIQYSHSELARHISIPCWDHHQGRLDYKLHNYKLTVKVYIKRIRCIKVKIVGYLCWFLGPLFIGNCLFTCGRPRQCFIHLILLICTFIVNL
jgi:hypothetical protein